MPIGGPQDVQPLLNAGLAAQPLVTSADPRVLGTDAITQLVTAVRTGAISALDVMDRVGATAQAKSKAERQQAEEFVSPAAVEARKAALAAATSQANLAGGEAGIGQELLGSKRTLLSKTLARQVAEIDDKAAIEAATNWGMAVKNEDGSVDFPATTEVGQHLIRAQMQLQIANTGLAVAQKVQGTGKGGEPRELWLNAEGEDISPGAKARERYAKMRHSAWDDLFYPVAPKSASKGTSAAAPAAAAPAPAPVVTPVASQDITAQQSEQLSREMQSEGIFTNPDVALGTVIRMTPQSRISNWNQRHGATVPAAPASIVTPAGVVTPPAAPAPAPAPAPVSSELGFATGPVPGTEPVKVLETVRKTPQYDNWAKDFDKSIGAFHNIVNSYPAIDKSKTASTQTDIALANTIVQLMGRATGGARGMMPEGRTISSIEDTMPLLERIGELPAEVLKTHAFPEGVRRRLIAEGQKQIAAIESSAADALHVAVRNNAPENLFSGKELDLLRRYPDTFGKSAAPAAAAPSAPGPVVNIPGVGNVYKGADGRYYKAP